MENWLVSLFYNHGIGQYMKNQWLLIVLVAIFSLISLAFDDSYAAVPSRPTNLIADDVSPTQVNLTWDAPANDGGKPITGYKIKYYIVGQGACCQDLVSNTGNTNTFYSHQNLQTGKQYVYEVYAINADGVSDKSPQALGTPSSSSTPPESIPPNPPTGLTASDTSPTQIFLSWTAPTANNGPFVSGYKIEVKLGSGSFSNLVSNTGSTTTSYTHTGLTTGTQYTYRVYALNSVGQSNATNEANATPTSSSSPSEESIPPRIPRDFKASAVSDTEIGLSWQEPAENDGPPVTGYKIERKSGTNDFSEIETVGLITSYVDSGLTTGTTYTYRLSALNSIGASNTVTSSATPAHTDKATNLNIIEKSPTSIDLLWRAPSQTYGSHITYYTIEREIGVDLWTIEKETSGDETITSITGLETGRNYVFRIITNFNLGSSPPSDEISVTLTEDSGASDNPPGPPLFLTVTNDSPTTNTLIWQKPDTDGGKPITGYKIEFKFDEGDWQTLVSNTGSSSTSYTHNNIPVGEEFTYKVSAINSIGTSLPNTKSVTVDEVRSPIPSSPKGLTLTSPSETQINLAWATPDDDGGSAITGYKIEYRLGNTSYKILSSDTKSTKTQYEHKGLTDAGTYYYKVSAINSAGVSLPSTETSIILTKSQPPPPPPVKVAPSFIDTSNDKQYYIDRYANEPAYKEWFDTNFPDYTFQEAISLAYDEPEPEPTEPEPTEPEPKKDAPSFIDITKNKQYYLDRYNNEPNYKAWFDRNYPDYTIEEALSLAYAPPEPETKEAKPILDFVDTSKDPQYYIDRYNNEPNYKAWFDRNFPDYTIEEAVGYAPTTEEQCGPGTHLEDGVCVLDKRGGGCLIATAAFGSELAPQVQMLREIRDNTVLSTNSGSLFMTGFNQFYYSFSPAIADFERQNPIFKEAVKISITPMISTLSILSYVDIDSEEEILGYGIGIILLNIGMYLGAPTILFLKFKKKLF